MEGELRNLGFEDGAGEDGLPARWTKHERHADGYEIALDAEVSAGGGTSARISCETQPEQGFGALAQQVAAAGYRGKRVRLEGTLRTQDVSRSAGLWLRLDDADGTVLFLENMIGRALRGTTDWNRHEILCEVPDEAATLNVGFLLVGTGRVWCDDLSLDVVGVAGEGNEPARALGERGLENLAAFTKLLGYVRFFHPSDEAAAADWDTVARAGVQRIEDAEDLAPVLQRFFEPLAPTVRVFAAETDASPVDLGSGPRTLRWAHCGAGLGGRGIYSSERIDEAALQERNRGGLMQWVEAERFRGKKVRLRARVRVEPDDDESHGRLWLTVSPADGTDTFSDDMEDRPIRSSAWGTYEILGEVAEDAAHIAFGCVLHGAGRALLTDVALEGVDALEDAPGVVNPSFLLGDLGRAPVGWTFSDAANGYLARLVDDGGLRCGEISSDEPIVRAVPRPPETHTADLSAGISCAVPLALYADEGGTVPRASGDALRPTGPEGFIANGDDRTTRLAAVILAWSVLQHFYPYFDEVGCDWNAELRRALRAAATDAGARAFGDTLRRLVAALRDGHGGVYHATDRGERVLPVHWDWIEERLVVTRVQGTEAVQPGDVVRAIDGRPVSDVLSEAETSVSGATEQLRRLRALWALKSGTRGREVELSCERDGEAFTVRLPYGLDDQQSRRGRESPEIGELQPGIWYVDLDRTNDERFQAALPDLERARGIVFDLRGYPSNVSTLPLSHLIDEPILCAQWRIPQVLRPDRGDMACREGGVWTVHPGEPRLRAKAAFCTDARAISYAETYMGMVEHYRLAEIVGSPTAGTNGNVNQIALPGGYTISFTGMKVRKHDGSALHGVGIIPTHPVERTIAGVRAGRDEVLERAVEAVSR